MIIQEPRTHYRNRLPHITPLGGTFFITFRLADSLPASRVALLRRELNLEIKQIKRLFPGQPGWRILRAQKRYFGQFDHQLDHQPMGACHLRQPEVARILAHKLHDLDGDAFQLVAYCIMPNHVHLLIETLLMDEEGQAKEPVILAKIMHRIKGGSSRAINLHLGRRGALWQKDSYDHLVRNARERQNIIQYILHNPVKAGLGPQWEVFPYRFVR